MRLHLFIEQHIDEITADWVSFAHTLGSATENMTLIQLRDHAEGILRSIAAGIDSQQTRQQQYEKSRGAAGWEPRQATAASIHGTQRHQSNFTLSQLVAEFRALRATVLRRWLPEVGVPSADTIQQMTRFNEGIDQALAESIGTYSARSEQTRELFLAILGHDLRAPLATLTLSGALLARPDLPTDEAQRAGARIRRSTLVMANMVDDLIGYTRTELGSGMPFTRAPTDIRAVCRSAIEDAHSVFPEAQFALECEGDLEGTFDSARLHQLFTNLLVNAAKYGTAGESVRMRVLGEADAICADVNNRGPVIPRSDWCRIFEPLVQLSSRAVQDHPDGQTSLGLGLYVAREIARLHGGSIGVDSAREVGTTFRVRLPRYRQATPSDNGSEHERGDGRWRQSASNWRASIPPTQRATLGSGRSHGCARTSLANPGNSADTPGEK